MTWDDEPYYLVSFAIHKSRRYHAKMRAFYQRLNDVALVGNALAGAGAFLALFGGKDSRLAQILVGVVAATSAVNTALRFSKKTKLHEDLCRRFTDLAAKIETWQATEKNYRKACAERLRIEKDEPTEKRLIDLVARNEEMRARGYSQEDLVPLSFVQRCLGYFATFGMRRLEEWRARRDRLAAEPPAGAANA